MRSVVVGTAGHVDHGKSSLVRALTGTDPDRLREERERGITIDLGFAHLALPSGLVLGFVDVPGHERFVKNMLAGASGMDVVVLVVSCDESVMPQTREHLDVCRLLGVRAGVIALTKCDLVDDDMRELVRLEVGEVCAGTFLEQAPVVACSATTREGLDELLAAIEARAGEVSERPSSGPFRMAVDRAFTLRGFGTVVTGTASSGAVRAGDELELLPAGRRARVRGVQVHGGAAELGLAGQRVALNLGGVDHQDVERGDVAVMPGSHVATDRLDASIVLLPSAPELPDRSRLRLHLGTSEVMARVRWPSGVTPEAGSASVAQLVLESPLVAAAGDRFILRRYSPIETIGGGRVVHPAPPARRRRSDSAAWQALQQEADAVQAGELAGILTALVVRSGPAGCTDERLGALTGRSPADVAAALEGAPGLTATGDQPRLRLATEVLEAATRRVLEALEQFHAREPLHAGMPKQALLGASGLAEAAFVALLARAEAAGRLRVLRDVVASGGHEVRLTAEEQSTREALLASYLSGGVSPPDLAAVIEQHGLDPARAQRIQRLLVGQGELLKLKDGLHVHAAAMAELLAGMSSWYAAGESFTVPDFKDRSGVSRKHGIPLLEYLDSQGYSRRAGDGRVWTGKTVPAPQESPRA